MKLIKIILFFALLPTFLLNAQVGIGTTNPNASLDIRSSNEATPANTDGILIPKIDEYPASYPTVSQDGMLVYATGDGSVSKGFYYWDNGTTNWISLSGSGSSTDKIDDLTDGKSDSDGSDDGSSIFIGVDAGLNDDSTNNHNVAVGANALRENTSGVNNSALGNEALIFNIAGYQNTAIGQKSLNFNTIGSDNTAVGNKTLRGNTTGSFNVGVGAIAGENSNGSNNVLLGYSSGFNSTGSNNVFLGYFSGFSELNSNRLYIENSLSSSPLIYGEFDNDLLRVNGDFEVEKSTDVSITAKSPFGNKSSLKLFESGGSGDYGFEFEYDGSPDKFYLWSRTFSGNEGIRMTWLKDGKVGISTTSPTALLDISSTNPSAPKNTDGMLVPRLDAFPSTNPGASQNGMLIFLSTDSTFYFWRNSTTSWVSVSTIEKINDLTDGKSDNDGSQNYSSIYLGLNSGYNDDSSDNRNVGIGNLTLYSNTIGEYNAATGYRALYKNSVGDNNTANGYMALFNNAIGKDNVAVGYQSLYNNTGNYNTAIGKVSLYSNINGYGNVAIGDQALEDNTDGDNNCTIGYQAMMNNTTGDSNISMGFHSLNNNRTGSSNVAIGQNALYSNTTFSSNTAIGSSASYSTNGFSNTTAIGAGSAISSPNQVRLGNSSVSVIGGYAPWSNFSDKRIKTNIKEDVVGLEFIKKLRPVSYNLDMDAIARFEKTPDKLRMKKSERLREIEVQTGFIAQEVEAAAKEVGFNFHGVVKPYTKDDLYALSYSEFVVPLVKAVQEQQEEIELLKKEIAEIKALLTNK